MKKHLNKEEIQKEYAELYEYLETYVHPIEALGYTLENAVSVEIGQDHGMHILSFSQVEAGIYKQDIQDVLDAAYDNQQPEAVWTSFMGTLTISLEYWA